MRIVQIPRRFVRAKWGGTETVVLETSRRLSRMGHNNEVVCPNALSDRACEKIQGVCVSRVPYFYPYLGLNEQSRTALDEKGGNLFSFSLMRALWSRPDLDLIHLHTLKRVGGIGRFVARRRGIPYVVSLHGGVHDVPAGQARSWTEPTQGAFEWGKALGACVGSRRVLDDAAAIICVGKGEQLLTQQRYPDSNVVHLGNGVDWQRFAHGDGQKFRRHHGISKSARVLLSVGRIDPQKNQLLLVRMLPELLNKDPSIHLLLIGAVTSSSYRDTLSKEIERLGLTGQITIAGQLDAQGQELVNAYHAADVFVLPSIHEPFGIVILEAWAAGLPVVASAVGGVRSLICDGEDGILCSPGSAGELLVALQAVLTTLPLARKLALNGRRKARAQYSWDNVTAQLIRIYEQCTLRCKLQRYSPSTG